MVAASGESPYCSVGQLLARVDERSVRQLLSDDDEPVTGELESNAKLLAILRGASGLVESAACAGQRYVINDERNDLASLTGNSAEFLADMVAQLAFFTLWNRRPNLQPGTKPPPLYQQAQDFLEQLRLGERVFGVLENHQAAALDSVVEDAADVEERRGVVYNSQRFFGRRNNRLNF